MKRFSRILPFFAFTLFGLATGAASIAEAAGTSEAPVYTNQDVEKYRSAPRGPSGAAPAEVSTDRHEKTARVRSTREQEQWCKRATPYRERVERAREELREKEESGGAGSTDGFVKAKKAAEKKARSEAKARKALRKAERALENLEQEAHRKGIPPGWLRCQFE